jgi:glycosyltransferase involved in cell wall biosynthesis
MERRTVSVIIPAFDAADTIGPQLDAVLGQEFDGEWEVVVSDNGSTDSTASLVQRRSREDHRLRYVDASAHRGSAWARNAGVAQSRFDVLAFCDADDVVAENWLTAITAGVDDDFVVVGGRLEDRLLNTEVVASWRPTRPAGLAIAFGFLPFAPSGNMAISRAHYLRLGGFDEAFMKAHDVEFSWRAQLHGSTIRYAPDAVVHYRYRSTIQGAFAQGVRSGRAATQLHAAYGQHGMPGRAPGDFPRDAAWLLSRAPTVLRAARRGVWVRRAGEFSGRLSGSVRFRHWYL